MHEYPFDAELAPDGSDLFMTGLSSMNGHGTDFTTVALAMDVAIYKEDSETTLNLGQQGRTMWLEALLSDLDTPAEGIPGRTITFYSDGEPIGSAETDGSRSASVEVPPNHRGANRTYEALFEEDDYYLGSSDLRPGQDGGRTATPE